MHFSSLDLDCSGSSTEYAYNGEKCPAVCGLPTDRCTQTVRDGCHCATGLFRNGATDCVAETACGCSDPVDGTYHMVCSFRDFPLVFNMNGRSNY